MGQENRREWATVTQPFQTCLDPQDTLSVDRCGHTSHRDPKEAKQQKKKIRKTTVGFSKFWIFENTSPRTGFAVAPGVTRVKFSMWEKELSWRNTALLHISPDGWHRVLAFKENGPTASPAIKAVETQRKHHKEEDEKRRAGEEVTWLCLVAFPRWEWRYVLS